MPLVNLACLLHLLTAPLLPTLPPSRPTSCAADAAAGFDPALLLSPLSDFPPLGCDTPESPDSLASGSDAVVRRPATAAALLLPPAAAALWACAFCNHAAAAAALGALRT